MTTKVNPFMQRKPGKVHMPGSSPGGMPVPRIVIEVNPTGTTLRTEGPLTIPAVLDILIGQLTSLWGQWMRDLMKQGGLVDPKTGLPMTVAPAVPGTPAPGEPGQEPPPEILDEPEKGSIQ